MARHVLNSGLAVLVVIVWGAALAQEPSVMQPLNYNTLIEAAEDVFDSGPGAVIDARIKGLDRAQGAVPGALRTVDLSLEPDVSLHKTDDYPTEGTVSLGLRFQLGRTASTARDALGAAGVAEKAARVAARWRFVERVHRAYIEWWTWSAIADHLAEDLEEFSHQIDPLRAAADHQTISRLDLNDLEAEWARVDAEVSEYRLAAIDRAVAVQSLLQCRYRVDPAGMPDLSMAVVDTNNPWRPQIDRIAEFPEVRLAQARADEAKARSRSAGASEPPELHLGAGYHHQQTEGHFIMASLGVFFPVGNGAAPDREQANADRLAWQIRKDVEARVLNGRIRAEAVRYDALVEHHRKMTETYLARLESRQELLEKALAGGQANLDTVIRARRDLHEAHHRIILILAEMLSHQGRARLLTRILDTAQGGDTK